LGYKALTYRNVSFLEVVVHLKKATANFILGCHGDHLGNIRLVYNGKNGSGGIDVTTNPLTNEIIEENNYYSFGLQHKGYNNVINGTENKQFTYNGKELEEEIGLDWTDYGARRYMRDLGRWTSIDPYAEKYETLSPYAYVANNPINANDPDGRLIVYVNGLLFNDAAEYKLNPASIIGAVFNDRYAYKPERLGTRIWRDEPRFNGSQINYWWKAGSEDTRDIINDYYRDNKNVFVNGNHFKSQASDSFALGRKAGVELIAQLQNGTIEVENEETIKVEGHSQGGAFAAGMLTKLMGSDYAKRVEAGI
jgi:RHS repeat-associated protein